MDSIAAVLIVSQLIFTVVATLYFLQHLGGNKSQQKAVSLESTSETKQLDRLRKIKLTEPLSEKTRPTNFDQIVGQRLGLEALTAALCGPNPQHILIYGPPGVGKTAAARLALEVAKQNEVSPFGAHSKFVELDATTLQFDERSIADPLMGSVHDPIYQGAGAYGSAGIPQPKPGAVTEAHGGVLFIDEIGELHPIQMNKLLKVLEDRVSHVSSSYYSKENKGIPQYIHDVFQKGLPADFRLIGATTRRPEELPPALRSRCAEIVFKTLNRKELAKIATDAVVNAGFEAEEGIADTIANHSGSGRDCVNIVQMAASMAQIDSRNTIVEKDIERVFEFGRYTPSFDTKLKDETQIGMVNGLAVSGISNGSVLSIEATAQHVGSNGKFLITGIVEEEELTGASGKMKRRSTAKTSALNAITVIESLAGVKREQYNIHVNFPGGMPVDGPSAGAAIFIAIYSALFKKPVPQKLAMTGEISIKGMVCPVGGVYDKIEAAAIAGAEKVVIPKANDQRVFSKIPVEVFTVTKAEELVDIVFGQESIKQPEAASEGLLSAKSIAG